MVVIRQQDWWRISREARVNASRYYRRRRRDDHVEVDDWHTADRYQLEPVEAMWDRSERE